MPRGRPLGAKNKPKEPFFVTETKIKVNAPQNPIKVAPTAVTMDLSPTVTPKETSGTGFGDIFAGLAKEAKPARLEPQATNTIPPDLIDGGLSPNDSIPTTNDTTVVTSRRITGRTLILFTDLAFPAAFSFLGKWLGYDIDRKKLKMTKEEKAEYREMADEAAKELTINASAMTLYIFAMGLMYASKLAD